MTNHAIIIDRLIVWMILLLLAVQVSLFWAKLHTTPHDTRQAVIESRKTIMQKLDGISSALIFRLSPEGATRFEKLVEQYKERNK